MTSFAYLFLILNSTNYGVYYAAQYTLLLSSFFDITWFYQAYERFQFIAIRNIIVKLLTVVLTFELIHDKSDLVIYILINGCGALLSNITLWFGISEYIEKVPVNELNLRRHLKDIMIFFLPTIAASVYSILDKSVINWVTHEDAQNGYYEQAYKILQICNVTVQTLAVVSSPRMSHDYTNGDVEIFKNRLNASLRVMLMVSMPIAFGVSAIAETFVPVFFGGGYEEVIRILYVFMPLVVVLGFSVYLDGMYLVPSGKRLQSAMAVVAGSFTNLFVNYVLVKQFAAYGAAIATLITELLVTTLMVLMSKQVIEWRGMLKAFSKYLLCGAAMFTIVISIGTLIPEGIIQIIVQVGSGVIIYAALMIITKDEFIMASLMQVSYFMHKLG